MSDLFIFAGEASGDSHAASLVQELKLLAPQLALEGVAGPKMRNLGVKTFLRMEEFQVMGFSDVIQHFPALYKHFYEIKKHLLKTKPRLILFIDYPGFNLRLAKALRKDGYKGKMVHYICPSVWAWGKKRVHTLANTLDELLTIYPFEKDFFAETNLKVSYIGNPVVEAIETHTFQSDWRKMAGLPDKTENLIAVFPGSRQGEIARNLPVQLQALQIIKEALPHTHFALSVTSPKLQAAITPYLAASKVKLHLVPSNFNYELMQEASSAIAKSGTITLELALLKRPTTVVYGLSRLNRFIAQYLLRLKLPYYCIVNILLGKEVFPELIKEGFDAKSLAAMAIRMETDATLRKTIVEGCEAVKHLLGPSQSSKNAAKKVLEQCDIS